MGDVIWLTGLPCSGKTTIAKELEQRLEPTAIFPVVLDGDELRKTICSDLGFSKRARIENNRRIAELACLLADLDITPIVAAITPYQSLRNKVKKIIEGKSHRYIEVYVQCPVSVCRERDVKGMYRKAERGEIKGFTGVDAPFEVPLKSDIIVNTEETDIDDIIDELELYLLNLLPL